MKYVWRGRKLFPLGGKEPFERVKGPRYGFFAFTGLLAHWDPERGVWVLPFLDQHVARITDTAAALKLDHGLTREALLEAILTTVRANDVRKTSYCHVNVMNTEAGIKPLLGAPGRFAIFLEETGGYHPAEGVHLVVLPEGEEIKDGISPVKYPRLLGYHHKFNANYLMYGAMKSVAKQIFDTKFSDRVGGGVADGIVLGWRPGNKDFFVTECTTSNLVFAFEKEAHFVSTRDFNLNGITQQTTEMLLDKEMGIRTKRVTIPLAELRKLLSAGNLSLFETGTSAGLTNILSVDGQKLKPWHRLGEIQDLYRKVSQGQHPKYQDRVWIVEPGPVDGALIETAEAPYV